MKILIVVKQTPDSTTRIKIAADGSDIDRAGVKMVVNPFDEFAIELAAQLRGKRSDVEQITALTIGPASAAEVLRTALAVGADDGIHLQDEQFAALDDLQRAAVIASVVKDKGFDLIITGKQEIDHDAGHTGPALGELLDWPHVGAITKFELSDDGASFSASRRIEGAEELVEAPLPAVVTIEKGLVEMRYPPLPALMKAKKKPVQTLSAADVPDFAAVVGGLGGAKMHDLQPPPERPPGKIIDGEPDEAAKELVRLLRDEAKVL